MELQSYRLRAVDAQCRTLEGVFMQKSTAEEKTTESPRQAAMNWISSVLETIATCVTKQIASWHWETDGTEGDTTTYQLVVIGSQNRRAIKLFTTDELDRCLCDKALQSEIHQRLSGIVIFLDGRGEKQRVNGAARKR